MRRRRIGRTQLTRVMAMTWAFGILGVPALAQQAESAAPPPVQQAEPSVTTASVAPGDVSAWHVSFADTTQVLEPMSPKHTGFKALFFDTGSDFKHMVTDLGPILWMAGGGAAALAFHPLDDDVNARLAGSDFADQFFKPGKYIGYGAVQIGAAIGTWTYGRLTNKRGRASHIGLDLLRAQIVTQTFTYALKYSVRRDRPDGTSGYSFPSGHASTTFATASVLERHFGWKAGIPTYILATYVAASRLHENRHFLSDVIFGGAVGMAAGRTSTRHGRNYFAMAPLVVPGGYGIAFMRVAN